MMFMKRTVPRVRQVPRILRKCGESDFNARTGVLRLELSGKNFAFGGPDNQYIYFEGAISGTFWKFKAPYPGLIGPGGMRLPGQ